MMDNTTFAAIKERKEELGAVDLNGMNHKKLEAKQKEFSKWKFWR